MAAAPDTSALVPMPSDTLVGLGVAASNPAAPPMAAPEPRVISSTGDGYTIPVQGVLPSQLRDTYKEARTGHTHEALDILAPRGTPVLAATDGKITKLHNSVAGGLMVYAGDAGDSIVFMYGHLDRYANGLTEGMSLRRGQVIGYVGTTGNAPPGTPHLHFAMSRGKPSAAWWKGTPVNPYPLLVSGSSKPAVIAAVPRVTAPPVDVAPPATKPVEAPVVEAPPSKTRIAITPRATAVIAALKAHDMVKLAKLAHPAKGVRFTPYLHVSPKSDKRFTPVQLRALWTSKTQYVWGEHDGSGAPIRLTFPEYYKAFVYDYDFAKAPRLAVDEPALGRGNSLNNIRSTYPGAILVEYHVPGIDPKHDGMDWRSLWLVFEKSGAEWYLTGIVHGSWTI